MTEPEKAKPANQKESNTLDLPSAEQYRVESFKPGESLTPDSPKSPPKMQILELLRDDSKGYTPESPDDPWLNIKLYYIVTKNLFDQWQDYQNKFLNKPISENEGGTIRRLLTKSIPEITLEEKSLLAALAFKSALSQKEESIMCEILRIESCIDLQVSDLCELVQSGCFAVLKGIVEKPVPVSRDIKRIFQSNKYHKSERVLSFLSQSDEVQYLEVGDIVDYMLEKRMPDSKIEDLMRFIDNKADKTALRSLLVHMKEKLAEKMCREGYVSPSDEVIVICLEFKCYSFLITYMSLTNYELTEGAVKNEMFNKIIEFFKKDTAHTEIYLYMLRKYFPQMPFSTAHDIVQQLNEWLHSRELMIPFVKGSVNPTKICVLLLEILKLIIETYASLAKWGAGISESITTLTIFLLKDINDTMDLHTVLMDQDLDGRPIIEIASFNGFLEIFNHKSIATVTERIWIGPYECASDPFGETSALFGNLRQSFFSKLDYFDRTYVKSFQRDYTQFKTHSYQYVTWRDGIKCRYILESLFYIAMFAYIYSVFFGVTTAVRGGYDIVREFQVKQEPIKLDKVAIVYKYMTDMYDYFIIANWVFLFLFILSFRHLAIVVFSFLTKRSLYPLTLEFTLDIGIDIVIAIYYFFVYDDVQYLATVQKNKPLYLTKVVEFSDGNQWAIPTYTLFVVLFFLRVAHTFEVHSVIGPFVKMVKQMAAKMGTFGLLFLILLLLFSLVSYIFTSYDITVYRDVYRCIISLFQASVGVFDLNQMNERTSTELFTLLFVVIFNIMLLNLLIAILSQVYTVINMQGDMLYVNELVTLHSLYAPHNHYGSVIASYPPFNMIFGYILLPMLVLLPAESRIKVNRIFLYIQYFFAFLIIFPVYLAIQCVILGLCYVKVIIHKFILIFIGKDYDRWFKRALSFISFLIFGPILLLPLYTADAYYFTIHAFNHQGQLRFPETLKEPMDKVVFKKIAKFIQEAKKRFGIINWEKLQKPLHDLCAIKIEVISEQKEECVVKTTKSKYMNYKNYVTASQVIKNVSTKNDKGQNYIDLEILSALLENYVFLSKLHKTQSRLLNISMSGVVRHTSQGLRKSSTAAGLRKIPSFVVSDTDEEHKLSYLRDTKVIYTKLFWTYSLEKYTNALIAFKLDNDEHWFAKNLLMISSDAQILKGTILNSIKPESKRPRADTINSPRDAGSRDDSLIITKPTLGKNKKNNQEVGQELDSILRKIETGPQIPLPPQESTVHVSQAHISIKNKTSLFNPDNANDISQ